MDITRNTKIKRKKRNAAQKKTDWFKIKKKKQHTNGANKVVSEDIRSRAKRDREEYYEVMAKEAEKVTEKGEMSSVYKLV